MEAHLDAVFESDQNFETDEGEDASELSDTSPPNERYGSNYKLHERINALRTTIQVLKEQLQEERDSWQRELKENRESEFYCSRNSQMGIDYFADYDRYHDMIMQTHYESRQNIQKQIAMANYKRRLLEVENMCTLELLRVKQSVQILQPLQIIANEWKFENESGDHLKGKTEIATEKLTEGAISEVEMPLETITLKDVGKTKEQVQCAASNSDPVFPETEYKLEKPSLSEPNLTSEGSVNSQN